MNTNTNVNEMKIAFFSNRTRNLKKNVELNCAAIFEIFFILGEKAKIPLFLLRFKMFFVPFRVARICRIIRFGLSTALQYEMCTFEFDVQSTFNVSTFHGAHAKTVK